MPMHKADNATEITRLRAMWGDPESKRLRDENARLRLKFSELHPDQRETLEWLKASHPDWSEEKLMRAMED